MIRREEAIEAYEDNLRFVLKYVKKITDKYPQKRIIITSDHGDCFGEYGLFGHPPNVHIKELIEVPWFEVENKASKDILKDEEKAKRRLKQLGYFEQ